MADNTNNKALDNAENAQTVYVLEGEPDEVYNSDGQPVSLTSQQEKEIEEQIG